MEPDIQDALQRLTESLGKINALAEWVKLKEMENRTISPALQFPDTSACDLRIEIWYFKSLVQAIESCIGQDLEARALLDQLRCEFDRMDMPIPL